MAMVVLLTFRVNEAERAWIERAVACIVEDITAGLLPDMDENDSTFLESIVTHNFTDARVMNHPELTHLTLSWKAQRFIASALGNLVAHMSRESQSKKIADEIRSIETLRLELTHNHPPHV